VGASDPATEVKTAQRLLLDLARRLEVEYPSADERVREGLDETLTVVTLKLSSRLRRSLATTSAAESLFSRSRLVKRNVKRWHGGQMMLRWVAAAVKGFRRLRGMLKWPRWSKPCGARDR
jgi:putative transposase